MVGRPSKQTTDQSSDEDEDEDEEDIETIPDEMMVLKPNKVIGVSRSSGIWMFKIRFEESILALEFYEALYIGGLRASSFAASCFSIGEDNICVKMETTVERQSSERHLAGSEKQLGEQAHGPDFARGEFALERRFICMHH